MHPDMTGTWLLKMAARSVLLHLQKRRASGGASRWSGNSDSFSLYSDILAAPTPVRTLLGVSIDSIALAVTGYSISLTASACTPTPLAASTPVRFFTGIHTDLTAVAVAVAGTLTASACTKTFDSFNVGRQ